MESNVPLDLVVSAYIVRRDCYLTDQKLFEGRNG